MTKIYLVRHQARGFLMEFPFSEAPSQEQLKLLRGWLESLHGKVHKKTGKDYWMRVVEVPLLNSNSALPIKAAEPVDGYKGKAGAKTGEVSAKATGTVTNK